MKIHNSVASRDTERTNRSLSANWKEPLRKKAERKQGERVRVAEGKKTQAFQIGRATMRNSGISIDDDFNAWLLDQAAALRRLRPDSLDWDNLAEELEAMARKDRTSLRSHLQNLLCHLLKWHYQPSHRGSSWKRTIDECRDSIEDLFDESPSLRNVLRQLFAEFKAYARALRDAARETGPLPYPAQSPWTLDQVLDPGFLPDSEV